MLRIVSKASSVESFVQLFRRFCDRESVFIATQTPKEVGTRTRFTVNLSTGAPMITGHGEVTEAYRDRGNPYGRPGMRLRFLELSEASRQNVESLVAGPAPQIRKPPPLPGLPSPSPHDGDMEIDQILGTQPTEPHVRPEPAENRAKGSDLVLPANPFGELSNESLEAFVECAMYEDIVSDVEQTDRAANRPRAVTWWPPTGQSSALPITRAIGTTGRGSSALSPQPSPPQQHGFHERRSTSPIQDEVPAQGKVMHTAMIVHPRRTSPARIVIAAVLVSTVVGLGVGYLLWGSARETATGSPDRSASASALANSTGPTGRDGGDTRERMPAASEERADAGSDAGDAATAVQGDTSPGGESGAEDTEAAADCAVVVLSKPDEADVFVGDRRLGQTPLNTTLPCGKTELVLRRERYADTTEVATLEPGERTRVETRLQRPQVTLEITSTPPGAMVLVDRKRVGKTPLTVEVSAFSRSVVVVRKSGYKRFRTRIHAKPPGEEIHADLSRRR